MSADEPASWESGIRFGGDQTMQMCGLILGDFPYKSALFGWVGNTMAPTEITNSYLKQTPSTSKGVTLPPIVKEMIVWETHPFSTEP